jgi:D-alanyl-D-alanine dipeptidase
MNELSLPESILWTPIPNMDTARELRKGGYTQVALDVNHRLFDDPIVSLADYGVRSRSYYSRRNVTGDAIPGVNPDVVIRRDVAERLTLANRFLMASEFVTRHSGGEVQLYVEEGLRSTALQGTVYNTIYPNFLRSLHPDWAEEEIMTERDRRVAKASLDSPHASGGALDVKLVRFDGSGELKSGFNHADSLTIRPDYCEQNEGDDKPRINRRILYHVMTELGFVNNPEEVWHYGTGDKLSSLLAGRPAYYAAVEGTPDYNPSRVDL